mmetsp:Transcript_8036/g.9626  ORF Transcript_8036/g.9626 Transcript_8036/m.9626 type:complete len:87 (+) Transcript_8036:250-510(+)
MALTNLSAQPAYKEKIVTLGGWTRAIKIVSDSNLERLSQGESRIILACVELLSNLSLSDQVQERVADPSLRSRMATNFRIIYNVMI